MNALKTLAIAAAFAFASLAQAGAHTDPNIFDQLRTSHDAAYPQQVAKSPDARGMAGPVRTSMTEVHNTDVPLREQVWNLIQGK